MEDGIRKNPYKGIIIVCIILIIVPFFFCLLFKGLIGNFQKNYSKELNDATAIFLGCGVGFLFQLSCMLLGLLKGAFWVAVKRIYDFFCNLSISFKFAITMYWDDIVENGAVFIIVMPIILITLGISINNLLECITLLKL